MFQLHKERDLLKDELLKTNEVCNILKQELEKEKQFHKQPVESLPSHDAIVQQLRQVFNYFY